MAKRQRVTRKDLLKETDQFLSFSEKALLFFSEYKSTLAIAALGAVIVGGAVLGFRYNHQVNALRMETWFSEMEQTLKEDKDKKPGDLIAGLIKKLEQFSSGPQKQRATLLLAEAYYLNKQYDEAISYYTEVTDKSSPDLLQNSLAQIGLAYSHEGKKDYKKAIGAYKALIDGRSEFPRFHVYLSLSRCYELDNDTKNALLILREMKTKFQGHAQINLVERRLKKLSASV